MIWGGLSYSNVNFHNNEELNLTAVHSLSVNFWLFIVNHFVKSSLHCIIQRAILVELHEFVKQLNARIPVKLIEVGYSVSVTSSRLPDYGNYV